MAFCITPQNKRAALVAGGTGYIGSHVVRQLGKAGKNIVILDNLSTGFADTVSWGEFIQARKNQHPQYSGRKRRPGNLPVLIADARKIKTVPGWRPRYDDLDFIVKTSLDRERKLAAAQ